LETQRLRIEYAESRRAALGVLGGVLLAAGMAALVQIAGAGIEPDQVRIALLTSALALIVSGITVVLLYALQTNWDYPFKVATSTWKWFYRDAIKEADAAAPKWHGIQSKEQKAASRRLFEENHVPYVDQLLGLRDDVENLSQDLEQVYVLHWDEFYKNRFLTQLRSTLSCALLGSLTVGVLAFLITRCV
jgi:hypothetical protein